MVSTSNWTLPAHASMLLGLFPRPFEAAGRVGAPYRIRPPEAVRQRMLPSVLRRAGYSTAAASANPWVDTERFGEGFDRFVDVAGDRPTRIDGVAARAAWWRAGFTDGAAAAAGVIRTWLEQGPPRPFFWFVNLMECHTPYFPPRPFNDLGPLERWRAVGDIARFEGTAAIVRACAGALAVPDRALARMRRLYAGAIRQMDAWIGRLLEAFDHHRLLDDTLVIVTSDHGENLGEGGRLGHALSLDDRLLRVPLVAAGPAVPPMVPILSLLELPRLIARAAGLDEHPYDQEGPGDGVAVARADGLQSLSGRSLDDLHALGLTDEMLAAFAPLACATDGRLKLVDRAGVRTLYDLVGDPLETEDASDRYRGDIAHLEAGLDWAHALPELDAEAEAAAYSPDELEAIEGRLRSLGYL